MSIFINNMLQLPRCLSFNHQKDLSNMPTFINNTLQLPRCLSFNHQKDLSKNQYSVPRKRTQL